MQQKMNLFHVLFFLSAILFPHLFKTGRNLWQFECVEPTKNFHQQTQESQKHCNSKITTNENKEMPNIPQEEAELFHKNNKQINQK